MKKCILIAILATCILLPLTVYSEVPHLISYQGRIDDNAGNPIPDGNHMLVFSIYDVPSGGPLIWTESHFPVGVSGGFFNILLGSFTPLTNDIFSGSEKWMGMRVDTSSELTPRIRITSVAYAIYSNKADTALYVANGRSGWTVDGLIISTDGQLGITKGGAGNVLFGDNATTMVNLGVACTTGINGISDMYATIGGGYRNSAVNYSTVGGGSLNTAIVPFGGYAVVGGGNSNAATGNYSAITGGNDNSASGSYSSVSGGNGNSASGVYSMVGGGNTNIASGFGSIVGGGRYNKARGDYSIVVGGGGPTEADSNSALGVGSFIGGGRGNIATGFRGTVSGGYYNIALGTDCAIGGGFQNSADGISTTIGGGWDNAAVGYYNTISGGSSNSTGSSLYSTISGGNSNSANGIASTIGGGQINSVNADGATISGGRRNSNSGDYSSIPGGDIDSIGLSGDYSMVFGREVYCDNDYRVVLFDSLYDGSLNINRDGRDGTVNAYPIQVGTNTSNGNGAYLTTGGVWTNGSSRTFKESFIPFNGYELLTKISNLSVTTYKYKNSTEKHVGPVAEEFVGAFDVGVIHEADGKRDDMYLSPGDVAGVALAGVQELIKQVEGLKKENAEIKAELARINNNAR